MAKKTLLLTESDFQALKTNGSVKVVPVPAQDVDDIGFARFDTETLPVKATADFARRAQIRALRLANVADLHR